MVSRTAYDIWRAGRYLIPFAQWVPTEAEQAEIDARIAATPTDMRRLPPKTEDKP